MNRRRLILAICIAVVALGAVKWWDSTRLTVEERRFLGVWKSGIQPVEFRADHRFAWDSGFDNEVFAGYWRIRDGWITYDYERNAIRRALRPLVAWLGLEVGQISRCRLEWVTNDYVTAVYEDGSQEILTRESDD
jgi:hypothetical protein